MTAGHTAAETAGVRVPTLIIRALLPSARLAGIRSELAGLHLFHRLHCGARLLSWRGLSLLAVGTWERLHLHCWALGHWNRRRQRLRMTHRTTLTGRYPASRRLRTTGVAQWSATVVIEQASEARVTTEELRGCHAVGVPGRFAARRLIRTHGLAASKLIAEWCGVHLQAVTCTCIAATVLVASARRIFSCKIHAGDVPGRVAAERVDQAHAVTATLVGAVWQRAWHAATLQQIAAARWNWASLFLGGAGIAGDTCADAVPLGVAAIGILRTHGRAARRIVACAAVMGAAAIAGADIAAHVSASARSDGARNVNAIRVPFRVAAVGVLRAHRCATHRVAGCSAWVWLAGWSGAEVAAHGSHARSGVGWQRGRIDALKVPSNGAARWIKHAHRRAAQTLVATR